MFEQYFPNMRLRIPLSSVQRLEVNKSDRSFTASLYRNTDGPKNVCTKVGANRN